MERLTAALQRSKEDKEHKISILFIDLDRFKNVNDSLGHHLGDKLLIAIAERLSECVRPEDLIARLGGDEFTILVEGRFDQDEVHNIAKRINRKFGTPFDLAGHEIYSSASIGILNAMESHGSAEEMMRDADTAMYQAKRAGKARHEVFDETMHQAVKETLRLETDLRRAVKQKEFSVVYQPIFSLTTGELQGLEALARWHHPTLGELPPRRFIELAEEIGMIDDLSAQIMHKACTEIGELIGDAFVGKDFRLGINLSSRQFAHRKLVNTIENILMETDFPAENLNLEITESAFFDHKDRAIKMLNKLRKLGVSIDIDDFGTGYSNLGCLVRLPVTALKIDRSFIKPSADEAANAEIVKMILAMARSLGLRVIAVGAETEQQIKKLREMNCDGVQGFALAQPMNFADTRAYLMKNTAFIMNAVPEFTDVEMHPVVQ
jgi:diguanylate cyclase (GGDEF)-like protein